jgi:hypothetical protein
MQASICQETSLNMCPGSLLVQLEASRVAVVWQLQQPRREAVDVQQRPRLALNGPSRLAMGSNMAPTGAQMLGGRTGAEEPQHCISHTLHPLDNARIGFTNQCNLLVKNGRILQHSLNMAKIR